VGAMLTLVVAPAQAQSPERSQVELVEQPLGEALSRIGNIYGVTVIAPDSLVSGKAAPSVSGDLTAEQAIARVLQGSGLVHDWSSNAGFVIKAKTEKRTEGRNTNQIELDEPQTSSAVLDPVIVLGEKFARSEFNTFTSVEVLTSDQLDDHVRQSLDDALNSAPNIRMFETSANSNVTIRGLNAEGPVPGGGGTPVISVSVDGAEQGIAATRRGTRGIWDLAQIEVLRGPQSTLQGSEALGGAVVIKTKDPTFTPEAIFRQEIDTDGLYSGAFAVSTPIIADQLAVRLAGQITRDDKDISYSDPAWAPKGDEEFEEIRGKLLFTPAALPGFTGLLTASRTHDKPAHNLVSGPDFFARNYETGTAEEFRDTVVNRYVADLTYDLNSDWIIHSITSYVDTQTEIYAPPSATFYREADGDIGTLLQDIRLTYGTEESVFSGLIGLYASRTDSESEGIIATDTFSPGFALPFQITDTVSESQSLALYADGRYRFADRWTLLAGARVLEDEKSTDREGTVLPSTPYETTLDEVSTVTNTEFLPKLGVAFALQDNQNVALTASKGYRPGFTELIIGTTEINTVDPETMWAYELAYRSKWMDDQFQVNGNIFYYDYTDMQVPVPVPGLYGTIFDYVLNAGKAHSYGAEIDARWNIDSRLEIFGSLGLLQTEFDEGEYAGADLTGNEFPNAPSTTATIGGTYRHPSGWFVSGDASFTDGYYSKGEVRNRSVAAVDSFTVVNSQAGYEFGNFTFVLYAKNLLDEEYLTGISSTGESANIGDQRTFGLQLTQRF